VAGRISRRLLARHAGEQLLSGARQETVVKELAAYLIENHRAKEADLIIDDITRYLADHGVVIAEVTSAFGLAEATKEALKALITKETGAKDVELTEAIDKTVLGGVKLALPGRELDTTIARKLNQLRAK
jgi:F0F1-type ATP synthase delta subunit